MTQLRKTLAAALAVLLFLFADTANADNDWIKREVNGLKCACWIGENTKNFICAYDERVLASFLRQNIGQCKILEVILLDSSKVHQL